MLDYQDFKIGQLVKIVNDADDQLPTLMVYDFEKKILNYVIENKEKELIGIIVEDYTDFTKEYSKDDEKNFDNFKAKIKDTLKNYLKYNDYSFGRAKNYMAEHFSWVYINNMYYFISKDNLKILIN